MSEAVKSQTAPVAEAAETLTVTINGQAVKARPGQTILEVAKENGYHIPTLCHFDLANLRYVNEVASCRICMVEDRKRGRLYPACATPVSDGMDIQTNSLRVIRNRRNVLELILSDHPFDCLVCWKNGDCELQALASEVGLREIRVKGERHQVNVDTSSLSFIRDSSKCILCKRCVTMCSQVQSVNVYSAVGRGFNSVISTAFDLPMIDTNCTFCGQCLSVCPTGALAEVSNIDKVWAALTSGKHVVVQTAPAVRVALGEAFGMPPGSNVTGRMVTALKQMGFNEVFDTNFAADLTIMEEATELVHRIEHGGRLPILTSCCPGWVKFFEHQFSDMLDVPSSSKSPHEMFGSVIKTYFAERQGLKPEDIIVVSVMPCVAKKFESARPELMNEGVSDVDIVITTRELARMIQEISLDLENLEDTPFDDPFGESTGAAAIFGSSGGVIEAALRTAYEIMTGDKLEDVNFTPLRGLEGSKEATVSINGAPIRIGVASGLGNARKMIESIRSGEQVYHAIEIMACPGGCIAGGGQPYHFGNMELIKKRMEAIYAIDDNAEVRKSHENTAVQRLYREYLGEPYGQKAKELLHTTYTPRRKF
ncbi:MAG: NADH-dependent [FeFe] hydrogenase, group A6 [Bacillota bacterium]|nr:NADH-dependent [FeFe] hydrogenase, group A6 [Bacillota bacterium]